MTNQERQHQLDLDKYYSSQMYKEDLSGKMVYCLYCNFSSCTHTCQQPQVNVVFLLVFLVVLYGYKEIIKEIQ